MTVRPVTAPGERGRNDDHVIGPASPSKVSTRRTMYAPHASESLRMRPCRTAAAHRGNSVGQDCSLIVDFRQTDIIPIRKRKRNPNRNRKRNRNRNRNRKRTSTSKLLKRSHKWRPRVGMAPNPKTKTKPKPKPKPKPKTETETETENGPPHQNC